MLANSRFVSFSCSVITGASTEMVNRLTKLIRVARKMSPAIPQRRPLISGVLPRPANCFSRVANLRPTVAPRLVPAQCVRRVDGRGGACGKVAREDGDSRDAERRERHGQRVRRQDAEELRLYKTGCGVGATANDYNSDSAQ